MTDLVTTWNEYYDSDDDTAIRDKAFFDLEVSTLIRHLRSSVSEGGRSRVGILELGSGTGLLASQVVQALAELDCSVEYDGVDFSSVAIARATARALPRCTFHCTDFLDFLQGVEDRYDYVLTQRSLMAIMDKDVQRELMIAVRTCMLPTAIGYFSEGSEDGLQRIKDLRSDLQLGAIDKVWHSCYLDESTIGDVFPSVVREDFASLYWLITRVVYPYFDEPQHNQPIHRFAASLPQIGDFGIVKLYIVRPA